MHNEIRSPSTAISVNRVDSETEKTCVLRNYASRLAQAAVVIGLEFELRLGLGSLTTSTAAIYNICTPKAHGVLSRADTRSTALKVILPQLRTSSVRVKLQCRLMPYPRLDTSVHGSE